MKNESMYGTSLQKAFAILKYLSTGGEGRSLTQVAEFTGISKPTSYKLLDTLQALELVEKQSNVPLYQLGIGVLLLAHAYLNKANPLIQIAYPFLRDLNTRTDETVHLGVAKNNEVIYLSKLESSRVVRMHSAIGNSAPLYCTGLGKALLSGMSESTVLEYVTTTELKRYTATTITTTRELLNEVELTRRRGYSIDNEEHTEDVHCVGVPLQSGDQLFGAISIAAPKYRMDEITVERYIPMLLEARDLIMERLK